MSELMNNAATRRHIRRQLLTTTSALVLIAAVAGVAQAADDADRPTVWVELGAHLDRIDGGHEQFAPPGIVNSPRASNLVESPLSVQRPARYGFGGEAKVEFAPHGTDWSFSAAMRYGRSNSRRTAHQQTALPPYPTVQGINSAPPGLKLADEATGKTSENHTILDFMAGKDVGLGIAGSSSKIGFGIRFAQFTSSADVDMKSRTDIYVTPTKYNNLYVHEYLGSLKDKRSFQGLGPSISWDASAPIAGSADDAQFTLDWGLNAAVLFGRQKVRGHHQTIGEYISQTNLQAYKYGTFSRYVKSGAPPRSHSVVVPNVGGFAGFSLKFPNAKVSLGYRADFFFGAMDGGIDARKTYDRTFHGPFAKISIGLGG
jgi:hypothetical protein